MRKPATKELAKGEGEGEEMRLILIRNQESIIEFSQNIINNPDKRTGQNTITNHTKYEGLIIRPKPCERIPPVKLFDGFSLRKNKEPERVITDGERVIIEEYEPKTTEGMVSAVRVTKEIINNREFRIIVEDPEEEVTLLTNHRILGSDDEEERKYELKRIIREENPEEYKNPEDQKPEESIEEWSLTYRQKGLMIRTIIRTNGRVRTTNDWPITGWERREYEYDKERRDNHEEWINKGIRITHRIGEERTKKPLTIIIALEEISLDDKRVSFNNENNENNKENENNKSNKNDENNKNHQGLKTNNIIITKKIITNNQDREENIRKIDEQLRISEKNAATSIKKLITTDDKGRKRLMAGWPWFMTVWSRDELIGLKGAVLSKTITINDAKTIIINYFDNYYKKGLKAIPEENQGLNAKDAIGWLAERTRWLLKKKTFTKIEEGYLREKTRYLLKRIIAENKEQKEPALLYNNPQETWMDTISREGYCIETNSGLLTLYELEKELSIRTKQRPQYDNERENTRKRIKELFYNKREKKVTDSLRPDLTPREEQRPNLFLAYQLNQELLTTKEWAETILKTAKELLIKWDENHWGLTTINKENPLFHNEYTGTTDESYHNGDSWFFINNYAAKTMISIAKRISKEKIKNNKIITELQKTSEKIINSSIREQETSGLIGDSAELTPANQLTSRGALAQLWSATTLIEAIKEQENSNYD